MLWFQLRYGIVLHRSSPPSSTPNLYFFLCLFTGINSFIHIEIFAHSLLPHSTHTPSWFNFHCLSCLYILKIPTLPIYLAWENQENLIWFSQTPNGSTAWTCHIVLSCYSLTSRETISCLFPSLFSANGLLFSTNVKQSLHR